MATTKKKVTDYTNTVDIGQNKNTAPIATSSPALPNEKDFKIQQDINRENALNSSGIPRMIHDQDTGKITGVIINGKTLLTNNAKEAINLANQHLGRTQNPTGTVSSDYTQLTHEQQVITDEKQRLADEALKATLQPTPQPNLSPEQQSQIGQLDKNILNAQDPLSADIQKNANIRSIEMQPYLESRNVASLASPWNKMTAFVGKLPGGTSLINALSQDRGAREYLQDYSNQDNLNSIRKNIGVANTQITDAISYAKLSENTPENTKIAIQIYNEAISRKYKAISQLKQISESDQRAYTDSIKDDLTELELYFNNGARSGKVIDDNALYVALNKPAPKYLPNTQGVQ